MMPQTIDLQSQLELINHKRILYLSISIGIFILVATPILLYMVRGIIKSTTFSFEGILGMFWGLLASFGLLAVLGCLPGIFLNEFYKLYFKTTYLEAWLKNNANSISLEADAEASYTDIINSRLFAYPVNDLISQTGLSYHFKTTTTKLIQVNAACDVAGSFQKKNQINSADNRKVVFHGTFIKNNFDTIIPVEHYIVIIPKLSDSATSVKFEFLPFDSTEKLVISSMGRFFKDVIDMEFNKNSKNKILQIRIDKNHLPERILFSRDLADICTTNNSDFNTKFSVLSDSKDFASSVCDSAFISLLLKMNASFPNKIYCSFVDNIVYIGIGDTYNLLLPSFFTKPEQIEKKVSTDFIKVNQMIEYTNAITTRFRNLH